MQHGRFQLAVAVEENALPTEFRLFVKGWNETEKGAFLFDDAAAKSVMAAAKAWGVDMMIDLEHQALEPGAPPEPTARDARGWFNLELREDGSLWAVNVRWTEDGAARLREKRQRYISPAFDIDKEGRVTNIVNVAITALPATHNTPALVAASARARDRRTLSQGPAFSAVTTALAGALASRFPSQAPCDGPWIIDVFNSSVVCEIAGALYETPYVFDGSKATLGAGAVEVQRAYSPVAPAPETTPAAPPAAAARRTLAAILSAGGRMDPKLIQEALDALIAGDDAKCADILKGLVASAAGADPDASTEDAPPPAGDGGADETTEPAASLAAPEGDGAAPADGEDKKAMAAAVTRLRRVTGATSLSAALEQIDVWRQSHLHQEEEAARLAAEREALELEERKQNARTLVQLGAETPATSGLASFADAEGKPAKGQLAKRLLDEPLDEQKARVAALLAARGGKLPAAPKPPAKTAAVNTDPAPTAFVIDGETIELSAREMKMCADKKIEPKKYAETRMKMRRGHTKGN